MRKVSARLSRLLGDIEDCERDARILGLTQVVAYLLAAKLEAVELYANAESRREMVATARAAGERSFLIAFPERPQRSGDAEELTAAPPKAPRKRRRSGKAAEESDATIHRLAPRDGSPRPDPGATVQQST